MFIDAMKKPPQPKKPKTDKPKKQSKPLMTDKQMLSHLRDSLNSLWS
jgi:hypothetical protein